MKRLLVTTALPYANGSLHLGHLVEAVQADALVRYQKLAGRYGEVLFVCADDMHGTPIELAARKQGLPPEAYVEGIHAEHARDYAAFGIGHDVFYKTHSDENRAWAEEFYARLKAKGLIETRDVEQFYCDVDKRFLPDRYVKGLCPKCGTPDQYGDVCEHCNSTYSPTELKEPRCSLCGTPPVRRQSPHKFVALPKLQGYLEKFVNETADGQPRLQPEILNFVKTWLAAGLRDWDISRDAPYFGFEIPGEPGKYFYVWLDAPIGYLSSTEHKLGRERALADYWSAGADADIWHFIGKDIVYFHTLFWPAMLYAAGLREPARVHVHGMLTVNGEKMSKSRGTFINARQYLDAGLDPEHLRYYLASLLGDSPGDIDFSVEGFHDRINSELNNNLGNFCNRALTFLGRFDGATVAELPTDEPTTRLLAQVREYFERACSHYKMYDLKGAIESIRQIGILGNAYLQTTAPWKSLKLNPGGAHQAVSIAAVVAQCLCVLLKPIVPKIAAELERQLGFATDTLTFDNWHALDPNRRVAEPKAITTQVEPETLAKLVPVAPVPPGAPATPVVAAPQSPELDFAAFEAVDLRCGLVVAAEKVPKADKLLKLTVDLGEGAPRTIAAGIAIAYSPEAIVGKRVVVVANLKARTIRGIESRGMLLAGTVGDKPLLAELPADVAPGTRVK